MFGIGVWFAPLRRTLGGGGGILGLVVCGFSTLGIAAGSKWGSLAVFFCGTVLLVFTRETVIRWWRGPGEYELERLCRIQLFSWVYL